MRPFTVSIGMFPGSAARITFSLATVLIGSGGRTGRHADLTAAGPGSFPGRICSLPPRARPG